MLVGNLAEAAANEIGANALLARVGAYYHDIGKIKRPYFLKKTKLQMIIPTTRLLQN
ncbi:HDIG domain-containing metalloprotein [Caloramator sp. mosi_1]|uniref:HDIG domain-containing metalloprotein n=1 Tax=Caloramator sp. mosi_1 TaxID=3023090 RepID=UPI003FCCC2B4